MTSKLITIAMCFALQACALIPQTDPAAELTRQAHAWDDAIIRKDMPAVAANMAPTKMTA